MREKAMFYNKNHLLILANIDCEGFDYAGNKYPKTGYVETQNFTKDIDIRYGLYGIPWGKTYSFNYEDIKSKFWSVVKTSYDDDLIMVDRYTNRVKFKSGLVLQIGTIKQAGNLIKKIKDEPQHCFSPIAKKIKNEEIAGTKEWFKKYNQLEKKKKKAVSRF
jgi:hypothetical protein